MWKYFFLKENIKIRWWFCVLCSIYIVLFTYVLEPLKNESYHYNYPTYYNLIALIGFFFITSFFTIYLKYIYPTFFDSEVWTFRRFVMWFFLLFSTGILFSCFFDFYSYGLEYTLENIFSYFFKFQFVVDAFTIIPILFFFLSSFPNLYEYKEIGEIPELASINTIIDDSLETVKLGNIISDVNPTILSFADKSGKNALEITLEAFFYITSADNYVDIFYKNEEAQLICLTLRNTLKTIEEQNSDSKDFFRCHKAFIVNCQKVKAIKGNAKGYFLIMDGLSDKIPVSRSKNLDLEKRLPHLL